MVGNYHCQCCGSAFGFSTGQSLQTETLRFQRAITFTCRNCGYQQKWYPSADAKKLSEPLDERRRTG